MAGVKITDLGTLTTAVNEDLLYIVDVSDLSQSPQGTSKQIEVGNMFSSGSYTPTISGEVNGILVVVNSATFIRVGNIATCSVQVGIDIAVGEISGTFEMSLPVPSNFTSEKQLFGLMQHSYGGTLSDIVGLTIASEVTNNTCLVDLQTTENITMYFCTIQFQYEIVS
jgi:hypothetical protein